MELSDNILPTQPRRCSNKNPIPSLPFPSLSFPDISPLSLPFSFFYLVIISSSSLWGESSQCSSSLGTKRISNETCPPVVSIW